MAQTIERDENFVRITVQQDKPVSVELDLSTGDMRLQQEGSLVTIKVENVKDFSQTLADLTWARARTPPLWHARPKPPGPGEMPGNAKIPGR